jgi:hypothetical protein
LGQAVAIEVVVEVAVEEAVVGIEGVVEGTRL